MKVDLQLVSSEYARNVHKLGLRFSSLSHLQGILNFHTEVPDCALQAGVSEQDLYSAKILGPSQ